MFSVVIYSVLTNFFSVFFTKSMEVVRKHFLKLFCRIQLNFETVEFYLLIHQVISKGYYEFLQLKFRFLVTCLVVLDF